ncbi:hypothetical protein B0H14DRAFT_2615771 [Mycena olivaceomarginata]|nr:hypothetical protein B0H14DRAFT_2615771 [Mycena olivaceomarginata]
MSTDGYASAPPEAPASCADDLDTLSHRIVLALETQLPALRELDFGEGSVWWRYRDTWTKFLNFDLKFRQPTNGLLCPPLTGWLCAYLFRPRRRRSWLAEPTHSPAAELPMWRVNTKMELNRHPLNAPRVGF